MDRHSLLDDDATPTQERDNVFDDQFEVDDEFEFDGVADGFRPSANAEEGARHDAGQARQESHPRDDDIEPVVRTLSAQYASNPILPSRSRNSMRKSRTYTNPFTSPDDDPKTEQEPRMEFEPDQHGVRRSESSASSRVYARTSSPRFGAGPSHPYGMYQQGTVARTASIATTSTVRPDLSQSLSQRTPQHPYAMYPQGVGEDDLDDEIEPLQHNPVPVGFPGIGQGYTRRMGPDGEEQDIIGEDGHTEQLPPYSRYPEEGPEKMPLLPTPLHSRVPVLGTNPGMEIMHTSLAPSQAPPAAQSMSDESTLVEMERRGSGSHLLSSPDSDSDSSYDEKKSWRQKTWRQRRHTKVCGMIPMWWLWVAIGVIIFIGAVMGGVLGGFWAGSTKANNNMAVMTSLWDASVVPSPTSAAIPTGTFALEIGPPEEVQSDCLVVANQRPAWQCDLAPNSDLALIVSQSPGGGATGARVQYGSSNMGIAYGSQLGQMNTSMASFLTVLDKDDLNNGVAFYFQQYYDKVVVVPNSAITTASSKGKGKRQGWLEPDWHLPSKWASRKQIAAPGDQPWFCVWNQTFLEGFIYITQPTSSSSAPVSTVTNTTSPTSKTVPASTAASTPATPTSTSYYTSTHLVTRPTTTMTLVATLTPGETPPWASEWAQKEAAEWDEYLAAQTPHDAHVKRMPPSYDLSTEASSAPAATSTGDYYDTLPKFPYVLKLEERRVSMPNAISPYCQLYQILDNGHANYVPDETNNGDPIIVQLNENDMTFGAYTSAEANLDDDNDSDDNKRRKRGAVPGACHCQWMSGE